ncbi:hypothetical protein EYF80_042382 [Liparis tanakae]|uniref:Uncharacterized protein n=1 Tax=Liparis tanakae TaxID=230148 RepID=A0A4Z2G1N6_9TELE|nr:hypothetical protein EYF80_042382 [Liparis tanakae]
MTGSGEICSLFSGMSDLFFSTGVGSDLKTSRSWSTEVGGGRVERRDAAECVRRVAYDTRVFGQHLSGSISEHSVSMSESYSEWPVGSLTGDRGSFGV